MGENETMKGSTPFDFIERILTLCWDVIYLLLQPNRLTNMNTSSREIFSRRCEERPF